jgi:hypothetical protein
MDEISLGLCPITYFDISIEPLGSATRDLVD